MPGWRHWGLRCREKGLLRAVAGGNHWSKSREPGTPQGLPTGASAAQLLSPAHRASSDWPAMGSYARLWSESHGQSWTLEGSEGQGQALGAHPSPPLASTHIRSGQILLLRSLLPVATWSTCSLLFHHTLRGRGGRTLQRGPRPEEGSGPWAPHCILAPPMLANPTPLLGSVPQASHLGKGTFQTSPDIA